MSPPLLDVLSTDLTSNCNLRCPYCINDYSQIRGNSLMADALFAKVLTLLPLVGPGRFLFSCKFEPTLHPQYLEFLERVPQGQRHKVSLTTNLAKAMPDEDFERLAASGIHHLNVSLDSLRPEIFERMRKGARHDRFLDNLTRLVAVFRRRRKTPPLRVVTMVTTENVDELPEILQTAHREFSVERVEFRTPWELPFTADYLAGRRPDTKRLATAEAELHSTGLAFGFECDGTPGTGPERLPGGDPEREWLYRVPEQNGLYIGSTGQVEFLGREVVTQLGYLERPYEFFRDLAPLLASDRGRALELRELTGGAPIPRSRGDLAFVADRLRRWKQSPWGARIYGGLVEPVVRRVARRLRAHPEQLEV